MLQNDVELHAYVNDVKINFSSKTDYYHESAEFVETSWHSGEQHILLQLNNVQLSDELWNPYSKVTHDFDYLSVK